MGTLKLGDHQLIEIGACVLREGFQRASLYTEVTHEGEKDRESFRAIHALFSKALSEGWALASMSNSSGIAKVACNSCAACYPTRVDLHSYQAGKKLTEITALNPSITHITLASGNNIDAEEHYDLYKNYVASRTQSLKELKLDFADIDSFKEHASTVNCLVEIRSDDEANTLQGAAWAVVYCQKDHKGQLHFHYNCLRHYYNPQVPPEQRLGLHLINQTFNVLSVSALTSGAATAHAYMGSWMATKGPFSYKEFFKPDLYIDGAWQSWKEAHSIARYRAANNGAKFEMF